MGRVEGWSFFAIRVHLERRFCAIDVSIISREPQSVVPLKTMTGHE